MHCAQKIPRRSSALHNHYYWCIAFCALCAKKVHGYWCKCTQLLYLRNVRKNGIESLALRYIIVIHWIIAFWALCAKWVSLLLMVILRKLRKNKCLRRLRNPTSLRTEGIENWQARTKIKWLLPMDFQLNPKQSPPQLLYVKRYLFRSFCSETNFKVIT